MTDQEPDFEPATEAPPVLAESSEPPALPEPADTGSRLPVLDDIECRVLGCLMEKQKTTPAYYPLTINSLTLACNQKSSRDPVVEYSEKMVDSALHLLRGKNLARIVTTAGSHVAKHRHLLEDFINLTIGEYAVLCVLLLRGPQTLGQLRTRSERIYKFPDLHEVQEVLDELANGYPNPWVTLLPREPGRKDRRYAHLLGDQQSDETADESATDSALSAPAGSAPDTVQKLTARVTRLEDLVEKLREEIHTLRTGSNTGPATDG